jgi:hypothetical protein
LLLNRFHRVGFATPTAKPGGDMSQQMRNRIQSMFVMDAIWASAFVAVLWAVILYVFFQITPLTQDSGVDTVLVIGGGLVLLFNTAAIVAMVRHYSHDKDFIYGLDIRHLDEARAVAAARRNGGQPVAAE